MPTPAQHSGCDSTRRLGGDTRAPDECPGLVFVVAHTLPITVYRSVSNGTVPDDSGSAHSE